MKPQTPPKTRTFDFLIPTGIQKILFLYIYDITQNPKGFFFVFGGGEGELLKKEIMTQKPSAFFGGIQLDIDTLGFPLSSPYSSNTWNTDSLFDLETVSEYGPNPPS